MLWPFWKAVGAIFFKSSNCILFDSMILWTQSSQRKEQRTPIYKNIPHSLVFVLAKWVQVNWSMAEQVMIHHVWGLGVDVC